MTTSPTHQCLLHKAIAIAIDNKKSSLCARLDEHARGVPRHHHAPPRTLGP